MVKWQYIIDKISQLIRAEGEERIFWPFKDAQFYIREGEEKVQSTGNFNNIKQIIG